MSGENSAVLRLDSVLPPPPSRVSALASRAQRELDVLLAVVAAAFIALISCVGFALLVSWLWMYEHVGDYAVAVSVPVTAVVGAALLVATVGRILEPDNRIGLPGLFCLALAAYPAAWLARGYAQDPTFPSWGLERSLDWILATQASEFADLGIPFFYYAAGEAAVAVLGGVALAASVARGRGDRPV